jgi:hypothetical protein
MKKQQITGLNFIIDKLTNSIENTFTGDVDFSNKSEPWTEKELSDFRLLMQDIKVKDAKREKELATKREKTHLA